MLTGAWSIRNTSPSDPYFSNVVLLLNGQGANGGTTWTDLSSYKHQMTYSGATTSTDQSKWGGSSTLNSSTAPTTNSVSVIQSYSEFDFGADEFTVELWFYLTTTGISQILVQRNGPSNAFYPYQLWITSGNKLAFHGFNVSSSLIYDLTGTTSLTTGQWYFVQGRRRNDAVNANFELALNGTQEAASTAVLSTQLYNNGYPIIVGNYLSPSAQYPLVGYWEDCRVTWKVARDFGVPTSAFPTS